MIVRGNEVTLTKNELEEIIIKYSAKSYKEFGIDDPLYILMQGIIIANTTI